MRRRALRVLARVVVASRNGRDLDDGKSLRFSRVAPDGDGQLLAANELLDEHFLVVAEGVLERRFKILLLLDDGNADARSLRRRLDDDRQGESLSDARGKLRVKFKAMKRLGARRRNAGAEEHAL